MRIGVTSTRFELAHTAQQLASELQLTFVADSTGDEAKTYDYLLVVTPDYLGLQKTSDKKFAPFYIDFTSGKMQYRAQQAGLRRELLARAMGCKPSDHPRIIDATAGLGRDSFILAKLGFEITLIERSPYIFALLRDALQRAGKKQQTADIMQHLELICGDSTTWLNKLPENQRPEIIYLDPMFPERQKAASVKKEMVILQDLLGKDKEEDKLFRLALTCARQRVVVKRPRLAPNLADQRPSFSLLGKSSRFDIYIV